MKTGINAWCFPPDLEAEDIFLKAKELGFEGVELNLEDKSPNIFHMDSTKQEIEEVCEKAEAYGIQLYSISTDLLWKYPLTSEDQEIRQQGLFSRKENAHHR